MSHLPRILLVNDSRVIRASLAKKLVGIYDVREEDNGESAWQALVLDASIRGVISGVTMPKLDGYGLLQRLRENRLQRLKELPFFLIVAENSSEEELQRSWNSGVTGFVPRVTGKVDTDILLALLADHLELLRNSQTGLPSFTDDANDGLFARVHSRVSNGGGLMASDDGVGDGMAALGIALDGVSGTRREAAPAAGPDAVTGLFTAHAMGLQLDRLLAAVSGQPRSASVLIFAVDSYPAVKKRFGRDIADRMSERFARLLIGKVRADDSVGKFLPGKTMVLAPGTKLGVCVAFADRIRKALAGAKFAVRGEPVALSVSVGVASMPEDGLHRAAEPLIALAAERLALASAAGGNQVVAQGGAAVSALSLDQYLSQLDGLVQAAGPHGAVPGLGPAGLKILPLLDRIDQRLGLGLPLAELRQRLQDLAEAEHAAP